MQQQAMLMMNNGQVPVSYCTLCPSPGRTRTDMNELHDWLIHGRRLVTEGSDFSVKDSSGNVESGIS